VEPLADVCGTPGFRGTLVENHWLTANILLSISQ